MEEDGKVDEPVLLQKITHTRVAVSMQALVLLDALRPQLDALAKPAASICHGSNLSSYSRRTRNRGEVMEELLPSCRQLGEDSVNERTVNSC